MSVSVQDPYKKYTAAPGATVFPTTFRVVLASDLQVTVDSVVVTSGFTLGTLGQPAGVDATFTTPMVGGEVVELQRIIPKSRTNDYQQLGDFNAAVVNADIDRLWMSNQELDEEISRAVQVPIGSDIDPADLINDLLDASAAAVAAAATADTDADAAAASAAAAAASAASTNLPALAGKALNLLRVKADETGYEARTPAQVLADIGAASAAGLPATVRQTVQSGAAAFLVIGTGLAVNIAATATPLRMTFASGFGANGAVDSFGSYTVDTVGVWSGLTANVINYLFIDQHVTTLALTGVASTLPCIWQDSTAAISVVNGQHTWVYDAGQMYVGNGATATAVRRTAVGECLAGAATITTVTPYKKQRRTVTARQNIPANGTAISVTHNMGVPSEFLQVQMGFLCVTADATSGSAVGDFIPMGPVDNGVSAAMAIFSGRLAAVINGIYTGVAYGNKATGARAGFTSVANFKMVAIISCPL